MGLVVALFIIGVLAYFLFRQNEFDNKEVYSNPKSLNRNILTIITICLAIVQAPFFYYYTFGLFAIFVVIPYLLISLILTALLLTPIVKGRTVSKFQKYGLIVAILIGTTSFFYGSDFIEKIDWELRIKERTLIVDEVLNGEIIDYNLKLNCFPPISNGGNEVFIDNEPDGTITVTFYIDRGFIDHYSAFIFTTDRSRIKQFDDKIKSKGNKKNKKIDENWYRISE